MVWQSGEILALFHSVANFIQQIENLNILKGKTMAKMMPHLFTERSIAVLDLCALTQHF